MCLKEMNCSENVLTSNQIRSTGLRNPVNQHSQEWDSLEDIESNAEAKEQTLSVMEPVLLLLLCKLDAGEVWLEEFSH